MHTLEHKSQQTMLDPFSRDAYLDNYDQLVDNDNFYNCSAHFRQRFHDVVAMLREVGTDYGKKATYIVNSGYCVFSSSAYLL